MTCPEATVTPAPASRRRCAAGESAVPAHDLSFCISGHGCWVHTSIGREAAEARQQHRSRGVFSLQVNAAIECLPVVARAVVCSACFVLSEEESSPRSLNQFTEGPPISIISAMLQKLPDPVSQLAHLASSTLDAGCSRPCSADSRGISRLKTRTRIGLAPFQTQPGRARLKICKGSTIDCIRLEGSK